MSSPRGSQQKRGKKGSIQPSLVVLTRDDIPTNFQRRRFNPDEYMNLFDKFKTNPFGPDYYKNSKNRKSFGEYDYDGDGSPNGRRNRNSKNKGSFGDYDYDGDGSPNGRRKRNSKNRGSFDDYDYDGDGSPNGRRNRHSNDPLHGRGNIIDLASVGSDFDINQALGDGSSIFSNLDLDGQSTSAYSYYPGDEELFKKLQKQLNLSVFGDLFPHEFDDMGQRQKRQLGRVARLQAAQKKHWYNGIWKLFGLVDNKKSKDRLWENLKKFMLNIKLKII